MTFAQTPEPPYIAVVFSSLLPSTGADYAATAEQMEQLAARQAGYLGIESSRDQDGFGITVSYWTDRAAAHAWKVVAEHREAQRRGRQEWYSGYRVRIATVERDYGAITEG